MISLVTLVTALAVAILLLPVAALLVTVFVLAPLAHLLPRAPMLSRATFTCPVSRRKVNAAFVSQPGADHPNDVESCSVFEDGVVRCKKGCLDHATTGWAASPMVPRYSLVADDVALRDVARLNGNQVGSAV
jgi:hypothetical protein